MLNKADRYIISGSAIYTNNAKRSIFDPGAVLIDGDVIKDVGEIERIRTENSGITEINLGAGLLTPGLVNLHHHLYSSFARGWNPAGKSPANFKEILENIWWRLDEALNLDDIYYSALVGLSESVLYGVTSVADHHSSQTAITGSLDKIALAYEKVGIRGSVAFEISDRKGAAAFEAGLAESLVALEKWPKKAALLTAMIGMHASMTLSDKSLPAISEQAGDAGFHFHLAEDEIDQNNALEKYGCRVTRRFEKHGLLNERSLAVHGVHLDSEEMKILKSNRVNLAICPRSNQNNAVGVSRWWNYGDLSVGLGTDGIGSDILQEARAALYVARHDTGNPDFGFNEIGNTLNNNYAIFEKITGNKIGQIAPGYKADLAFWRYNPPTPLGGDNILGHYLYGLSGMRADTVWVDGKQILRDGRFNFDYDAILVDARRQAEALWERI